MWLLPAPVPRCFPPLHAKREGYEVQVVADACGTSSDLAHEIALRRMEREGVTPTTTAQAIAELAEDFSTEEGGKLVQVIMQRGR